MQRVHIPKMSVDGYKWCLGADDGWSPAGEFWYTTNNTYKPRREAKYMNPRCLEDGSKDHCFFGKFGLSDAGNCTKNQVVTYPVEWEGDQRCHFRIKRKELRGNRVLYRLWSVGANREMISLGNHQSSDGDSTLYCFSGEGVSNKSLKVGNKGGGNGIYMSFQGLEFEGVPENANMRFNQSYRGFVWFNNYDCKPLEAVSKSCAPKTYMVGVQEKPDDNDRALFVFVPLEFKWDNISEPFNPDHTPDNESARSCVKVACSTLLKNEAPWEKECAEYVATLATAKEKIELMGETHCATGSLAYEAPECVNYREALATETGPAPSPGKGGEGGEGGEGGGEGGGGGEGKNPDDMDPGVTGPPTTFQKIVEWFKKWWKTIAFSFVIASLIYIVARWFRRRNTAQNADETDKRTQIDTLRTQLAAQGTTAINIPAPATSNTLTTTPTTASVQVVQVPVPTTAIVSASPPAVTPTNSVPAATAVATVPVPVPAKSVSNAVIAPPATVTTAPEQTRVIVTTPVGQESVAVTTAA